MNQYIRQIIVLILLLIAFNSNAVVLEVRQDPGLPDKCINVISRDKHGLMWMGTQSGLCVYDGYEFKQLYINAPINRETIQNMAYDSAQDILWVVTEAALFKVNCGSFKVEIESNGIAFGNPVTALLAAGNGHVYIAYKEGEVFDMQASGAGKKIVKIATGDPRKIFPIDIKLIGNDLAISCLSSSLYYRYSLDKKTLTTTPKIRVSNEPVSINGSELVFKIENGSRTFHVSTPLNPLFVASLQQINDIWNIASIQSASEEIIYVICRPCIIFEINLKTQTCVSITSDILTGRSVKSCYKDQSNVIWVGTNKGLIKIITQPRFYSNTLVRYPTISTRSLCVDDYGNLYAGTYSGVFVQRKNTKDWVKIGTQIAFSMMNVKGRYVYFIEDVFKIYRIDKATGSIETDFYSYENNIEKGNQAIALAEGKDGKFWIGMNHGLAIYDPDTKIVKAFKLKNLNAENLEVRYITVASNDKLLLCTNNGLYEVNVQSQKVNHWSTGTKPALSSKTLNYAGFDNRGYLWLCSESGGINILNPQRDSIVLLNTKSGLSSNTTYDILFHKGRAWISTYNGLSSYDISTKQFYNFYAVTHGLSDNEFNRNAFVTDSAHHLFYFGTINGINSFNPDSIYIKPAVVNLFASTISKWDNTKKAYVNIPVTDDARDITLGPSDHSLVINLAISDYSNPDHVTFIYRIRGLAEDWITINNQHSIQLNGLAPGVYNVDIKAIDDHGMSVANELHYNIKVTQPFFKSIWFYLMMLFIISAMISYFFFMKIRNINEITHIRQQIASDLHDEVGSMLTRITMNSDYLKYSKKADEETISKLTRISALSRYAASSMNDILWTIDSRNNFTGNLADRIREHAEEMLLPMSVDISFDIKVAYKESIDSETRQEIYLIFKEAVNNIVKHSNATEVSICFYYNKAALLLKMENNGLFADEKVSSIGQGLKNIKMRAHRIGAATKMFVENGLFKVEITKHLSAFNKK